MVRERGVRWPHTSTVVVSAAVAALSLSYAFVVPLGESPDEAAHLYYVDYLLANGKLPRFDPQNPTQTYEAHQPPLDYALMAFVGKTLGISRVNYPFSQNPSLGFHRPGSRAFVDVKAPRADIASFRKLRSLHSLWAPLTAVAISACLMGVALKTAPRQLAALCGATLSPQLLFTCASVNNDGAAIGISSAALAGFVVLATDPRTRYKIAVLTGALSAAAAWAKLSALFLAVPLALVARGIWRQSRDAKLVLFLTAPWLGGITALALWNRERVGVLWFDLARFSGGDPRASLVGLTTDWSWPLSLWRSFWAKFGWFNLPLPTFAYLAFVPITLLAVLGLLRGVRAWSESGLRSAESRVAAIAAGALGGNLMLLLVFTVLTAWRPQGRLLLPSIGAVALLAALGHAEFERRVPRFASSRWRRTLAISAVSVMILVNLFALYWIKSAYESHSLG